MKEEKEGMIFGIGDDDLIISHVNIYIYTYFLLTLWFFYFLFTNSHLFNYGHWEVLRFLLSQILDFLWKSISSMDLGLMELPA